MRGLGAAQARKPSSHRRCDVACLSLRIRKICPDNRPQRGVGTKDQLPKLTRGLSQPHLFRKSERSPVERKIRFLTNAKQQVSYGIVVAAVMSEKPHDMLQGANDKHRKRCWDASRKHLTDVAGRREPHCVYEVSSPPTESFSIVRASEEGCNDFCLGLRGQLQTNPLMIVSLRILEGLKSQRQARRYARNIAMFAHLPKVKSPPKVVHAHPFLPTFSCNVYVIPATLRLCVTAILRVLYHEGWSGGRFVRAFCFSQLPYKRGLCCATRTW